MRKYELKGVLRDRLTQHGLGSAAAERMVEEILGRFSRLLQDDLPGAIELFSPEELDQLLTEALDDLLNRNG